MEHNSMLMSMLYSTGGRFAQEKKERKSNGNYVLTKFAVEHAIANAPSKG
jgi:hypothetical protein